MASQTTRKTVGSILLDQSLVAGIGNMYRAGVYICWICHDNLARSNWLSFTLRYGSWYVWIRGMGNEGSGLSMAQIPDNRDFDDPFLEFFCRNPLRQWVASWSARLYPFSLNFWKPVGTGNILFLGAVMSNDSSCYWDYANTSISLGGIHFLSAAHYCSPVLLSPTFLWLGGVQETVTLFLQRHAVLLVWHELVG